VPTSARPALAPLSVPLALVVPPLSVAVPPVDPPVPVSPLPAVSVPPVACPAAALVPPVSVAPMAPMPPPLSASSPPQALAASALQIKKPNAVRRVFIGKSFRDRTALGCDRGDGRNGRQSGGRSLLECARVRSCRPMFFELQKTALAPRASSLHGIETSLLKARCGNALVARFHDGASLLSAR
jgi:hypothetical protein